MNEYKPSIEEEIKMYRNNMLVHSYIYYTLDDSIICDDEWQRRANKLVTLQKEHGWEFDYYDDVFKEWDGSTGMHLPSDRWIVSKAYYLIRQFG